MSGKGPVRAGTSGMKTSLKWDSEELRRFYQSFHKVGPDWEQVADAVGRSPDECDALYRQHQTFLSLPYSEALEGGFFAMVNDHYKNQENGAHEDAAMEDIAEEGSQGGDEGAAMNGGEHAAQSVGAVHSPRPPAGPSAGRRRPRPPPPRDVFPPASSKPGTPLSKPPPSPTTPGSVSGRFSGKAPGTSRLAEVLGTPGRLDLTALGLANVSEVGDMSSARKRSRKRKLFADEVVGVGESSRRAKEGQGDAGGHQQRYSSYEDNWPDNQADDVGEGVDALLSLASLAHASSSGGGAPEDSLPYDGGDGAASDGYEGGGEASGGGRRASRSGMVTPKRPIAGDTYIYRTGTPGNAPEFLLSSPDYGAIKASTPRSRTKGARARTARTAAARTARTQDASLEASDAALALQQLQSVSEGEAGGSLMRKGSAEPRMSGGQLAGSKRGPAEREGGVTPSSGRHVRSRFAGTRTRTGRRPARYADSSETESDKEQQLKQRQQQRQHRMQQRQRPQPEQDEQEDEDMEEQEAEDQQQQQEEEEQQEESESEPSPTPVGRRSTRRTTRQRSATARAIAAAADARQGRQQQQEQQQGGRRHRRKSPPEGLLQQLGPLRPLFSMTGTPQSLVDAALLGQQGSAAALAALQLPPLGETNEPMTAAERLLRHTLSPRTRRWVAAEWHCSALDRPYFLRNEMQELMDLLGLSHVTHLTRPEWGVLRSAFGRPRRLSLAFLREERARLEAYRQRVRKVYEEVGVGMEVPPELPRPLKVAQAVIARHPITRQLHDGIILTIKPNSYRVQFNRSELMTEVIADVDVMPLEPGDNLPLAMTQRPLVLNGRSTATNVRRKGHGPSRAAALATLQQQHQRAALAALGALGAAGAPGPAGGPVLVDEATRDADSKLLSELAGVLNRKEALLAQLRDMNATAEAGRQQEPGAPPTSDDFQKQYAAVLGSLQSINGELSGLLAQLEGRPHLGLAAGGAAAAAGVALRGIGVGADGVVGPAGAPDAGELVGSAFVEAGAIVKKYRALAEKARAARQGAGEGAAKGSSDVAAEEQGPAKCAKVMEGAADAVQEGAAVPNGSAQPEQQQQQQQGQEIKEEAKGEHARWLDEVITGCVCMLLTVQKCTGPGGVPAGGQAGVSHALDLALGALRPRAAANAATFKEVTESVAVLKAQLARVC